MSTSAISCCPADLMKKVSRQYYLDFTHGDVTWKHMYMYYSSPAVIQFFSKGGSIGVLVQDVQSFCGFCGIKRHGEVSPGWTFILCNTYIVSPSRIPLYLGVVWITLKSCGNKVVTSAVEQFACGIRRNTQMACRSNMVCNTPGQWIENTQSVCKSVESRCFKIFSIFSISFTYASLQGMVHLRKKGGHRKSLSGFVR